MRKNILLASACFLLTCQSFAQETIGGGTVTKQAQATEARTYKVKLGNGKDSKLVLHIAQSDINVVGYTGDEVIIEGPAASAPPKRAEGLKPLYNQAEDNTGLGLAAVKDKNTLTITEGSRGGGKYTIRTPRNASIVYKETNWNGGDINISEVDGEIELKLNNGDAILQNISGPLVANTVNGSLDVIFSSLNQNKPNAISTVNGGIDITLPANTKANFKLKSLQGEVYTDFDLNLKKEAKTDLPQIGGGNTIEGTTNGGGVEMSIKTINSEIYLRKKK